MSDEGVIQLHKNKTVVRIKEGQAQDEKMFPSPILYLGLVTLSGAGPDTMSSDAYKRRFRDIHGGEHTLTLYAVETMYEEVTGNEREALVGEHWPNVGIED